MAIPLTGAGSLGVRLGHIFGRMKDLLALRGDAIAGPQVGTGASYATLFKTLNSDLTNGTALSKTLARFAPFTTLASWDAGQAALFSGLQLEAQAILCAMYNLDQPTATPEDFAPYPSVSAAVVAYLITQMTGATLNTPTSTVQGGTSSIGAQTNGTPTPQGTPVIILSAKNVQGLALQLMFPETIRFQCSRDSQGGATLGNESLTYTGEAAAGAFDYRYPAGSGCSGSLSLVNGESSNDGSNLLQNSGFSLFNNANIPDNWIAGVGVVGTDILDGGAGAVYWTGNTHVLQLHGDGATLVSVKQSFNTAPSTTLGSGGTSYKLTPNTQYAFSAWVKVLSTVPAAGVLKVSLQDGAGNILNDDFGTACSQTFDLTAGGLNIGSTYTNINFAFRTPNNLITQTAPFKLVIAQSTAITSGKSAYIAHASLSKMTPLYNGGPFATATCSVVAPINGLVPDYWTFAVANNYATSGTGLFHLMFDRTFGIRAMGLQLPYTGSPTISDALIA